MMIHEITVQAGAHRRRTRVGRGKGSGLGKTSGRGQKGAGSRSGTARKKAFEGGQMPLFRRIRKFGFSNARFATPFWIVNLGDIAAHKAFAKGGTVTVDTLAQSGLIRDDSRDVKILGDLGESKSFGLKLDVQVSRVSASARKAIEAAGGSVNETGTLRDRHRGVDRNSDDKSPKNLTKKLKRGRKEGAKPAVEAEGAADDAKAKDAKAKDTKPKA